MNIGRWQPLGKSPHGLVPLPLGKGSGLSCKLGQAKRRLTAWGLLTVFLSMLFMASVHCHSFPAVSVDASCYQCSHHLHHSGHLSTSQPTTTDCVLCHFLSLVFIVPVTAATPVGVTCRAVTPRPERHESHARLTTLIPRAPPCYCLTSSTRFSINIKQ